MVPFSFVVEVVIVVFFNLLIDLSSVYVFYRIKLGIWNISFYESEFFLETVCSK